MIETVMGTRISHNGAILSVPATSFLMRNESVGSYCGVLCVRRL